MDLNQIINDAAQGHDWLVLAIAAVLLIVPVVMKALGKKVPIVDTILDLGLKVLPLLKKKPVEPPADPSQPQGIAKVVEVVKDPKNGPNL